MSKASLSWSLKKVKILEDESPYKHFGAKGIIEGIGARFRRPEWGWMYYPDSIFAADSGFKISWGKASVPDQIDPSSLVGGGEVDGSSGFVAVLFLGLLAKELRQADLGRKLILADQKGKPVEIKTWRQIEQELIRLGYFSTDNFAHVRHVAEAVGLIISFSTTDDENEHFYF